MPRHLTPTRRQILTTLKKQGELTATELAEVLNVTPVAVRQQLSHLQAADLVEHRLDRRPMGRPVTVFTLTNEADELFPRGYGEFATTLLHQIAQLDGEEKILQVFQARAAQMESEYLPRVTGENLGQRVSELAQLMDEVGSLAEWRPVEGGFEMCAYNCVLAKIAPYFPQACAEELALYKRLLKAHVIRTEHMSSGDRRCRYLITPITEAVDG